MQPDRQLSAGGAVARFLLASVAAIAVLLAGGSYVLRETGRDESMRNLRQFGILAGQAIVEPQITPGVLTGDPQALRDLDLVVQERILSGLGDRIARIKIWDADGRIVYSDEPRLIGKRFRLGDGEQASLATGRAEVEISDLSKPENRLERNEGQLVEAYLPIRGPAGEQLLFELYERSSSINETGTRLLRGLAPWLAVAGAVLLLVQAPLAWRLAGRVRRGQAERERLLLRAVESSAVERRRIASDLHDGVVQDLAGIAFGLEAIAEREGENTTGRRVREAVGGLRASVRRLRSLLVEIHPPNLEAVGIEAALADNISPLETRGVATSLHIDAEGLRTDVQALVFRVVQEALRNVAEHADATSVEVVVQRTPGAVRARVADDGRGFSPETWKQRGDEGHVGLALLQGLVADSGGTLEITSAPSGGTMIELEVPDS